MEDRDRILNELEFLPYDEKFMARLQDTFGTAVYNYDIPVIRALLKLGADPSFDPAASYDKSNHGFLHYLVNRYVSSRTLEGKAILEVLELLLKSGANPDQAGSSNRTPIQWCIPEVMKPVEDLLLKYGARKEGNPLF